MTVTPLNQHLFLYYLRILGFGFKKVDFLEVQTVYSDLCVAIMFTNADPLILL